MRRDATRAPCCGRCTGPSPARTFYGATAGGAQLGAAIAFYSIFALAPVLVVAITVAGLAFDADAVRGRVVGAGRARR